MGLGLGVGVGTAVGAVVGGAVGVGDAVGTGVGVGTNIVGVGVGFGVGVGAGVGQRIVIFLPPLVLSTATGRAHFTVTLSPGFRFTAGNVADTNNGTAASANTAAINPALTPLLGLFLITAKAVTPLIDAYPSINKDTNHFLSVLIVHFFRLRCLRTNHFCWNAIC